MTLDQLLNNITEQILKPVINILFILATVIFLWGIISYVIGSRGDEKKLEQGKKIMLWGIIGMTIMVSAWGIVGMICEFLGTC